jgi:Ser/Thr protein kinase RdoA (MazF antagonist)
MLSGYEQFRPFPRETLGLIEVLRGLRYIRYAAWIASRWEDPSFPRAFPYFGTDAYWEGQLVDLREQIGLLLAEDGRSPWES